LVGFVGAIYAIPAIERETCHVHEMGGAGTRPVAPGFSTLRIRGYVSTARKKDSNVLDAWQRVFLVNPFVPAINTA
jgi:hypothetical protein